MTKSNSVKPIAPPPGTPDELRSYQMLIAGAYNALWAKLREPPPGLPDPEGWARAVREIGAEIKPLLDWLAEAKSLAEMDETNSATPRKNRRAKAQSAESRGSGIKARNLSQSGTLI